MIIRFAPYWVRFDLGVRVGACDDFEVWICRASMLNEVAVLKWIWDRAYKPARSLNFRRFENSMIRSISRDRFNTSTFELVG